MLKRLSICTVLFLGFVLLLTAGPAKAQLGNAGSIEGVVKDPSGGVVAGAAVENLYSLRGFHPEMTTGSDGAVRFTHVPVYTYPPVLATTGVTPCCQGGD